ncbi:MAG: transcriptional repressor [Roseibium sp.]|uniref:Fur family transcriptional regulator n=1 Tax=Roseibium sp. TaxID=1936156 RepID=UPI0026231042|nr:Fur family transcriptional regulator [Roseibium sp.]MCV0423855.1 transcriptional repressor [Roseibium sp.]
MTDSKTDICDNSNDTITKRLRAAGLRPTVQRRTVAENLLCGPHQHVDASKLFETISGNGGRISLATIYNTLNDFERVGLLRRIAISGERTWFDTDTGDHRHYYIPDEDRVFDCPSSALVIDVTPRAPSGYRIEKVDVVIHLEADTTKTSD